MEIKLTINGKEIPITEEQFIKSDLCQYPYFGAFERAPINGIFYFIDTMNEIDEDVERRFDDSELVLYNCANYCRDKDLIMKRALYEGLSRRLWRFTKQNESIHGKKEWYIAYDRESGKYCAVMFTKAPAMEIAFQSKEVAEMAINEVITPFLLQNNIQSIEDLL